MDDRESIVVMLEILLLFLIFFLKNQQTDISNRTSVIERMDVPPATYSIDFTTNNVICTATGAPLSFAQIIAADFRTSANVESIELFEDESITLERQRFMDEPRRNQRNLRDMAEFYEFIGQNLDSIQSLILTRVTDDRLDGVAMVKDRPLNILRLKVDGAILDQSRHNMLKLEHLSCSHYDLELFVSNANIRKLFLDTYAVGGETGILNFEKLFDVTNQNSRLTSIAVIFSADNLIINDTFKMATKDIVQKLLAIKRDFEYFVVAFAAQQEALSRPRRIQEMFAFDKDDGLHVSHADFVELCTPRHKFENLRIDMFDTTRELTRFKRLLDDWERDGKHLKRLSVGIRDTCFITETFEEITNLSISIVNSVETVLEEFDRTESTVRLKVRTVKLLSYIREDVQMLDITFHPNANEVTIKASMHRIAMIDTLTELHVNITKVFSLDMTAFVDRKSFKALNKLHLNITARTVLLSNPSLLDLEQLEAIIIHDDDYYNIHTAALNSAMKELVESLKKNEWAFKLNQLFGCIEGTKVPGTAQTAEK